MRNLVRLVVSLTLFLPIQGWGGESGASDSAAFAESLMVQGRFHDAQIEWERLVFSSPRHPKRLFFARKMLDSALASGDDAFSLKLARRWEQDPEIACVSRLYVTRALYEMENPEGVLKESPSDACPADVRAEQRYVRGLSLLRLGRTDEAVMEFQGAESNPAFTSRASAAIQRIREPGLPPRKSPGLAGALSALLPGAGYAYARRPQTAAAAFLVNGLFIWGSYSAAKGGQPGVAALLSLFSVGWYFGGVYGSARAADRENQARLSSFLRPLEMKP